MKTNLNYDMMSPWVSGPFGPFETPRGRRSNATLRYVAPGSSLPDEAAQEGAALYACENARLSMSSPLERVRDPERGARARVEQDKGCSEPLCSRCSRAGLCDPEVLRRVQQLLDLLADLTLGDLEVLKGLVGAKIAAQSASAQKAQEGCLQAPEDLELVPPVGVQLAGDTHAVGRDDRDDRARRSSAKLQGEIGVCY